MAVLFALAVTGGGTISLLEEDGGAVEAIPTTQGTFGNFSETFNPAALAAAASPAAIVDTPYQPSPGARGVLVAAAFSGTMDAAVPVQAQLQRVDASGTRNFGPAVTFPTPGAAGFGGSITAVDTLSGGPIVRTYQILLTAAGHTFTVPITSTGFGHVDL